MNKECAFDRGRKCVALTEKYCDFCRFRKTAEELEAGRQRAAELVSRLPTDQRQHIKLKYYQNRKEE